MLDNTRYRLAAALGGALALAVYASSWSNGFVAGDRLLVQRAVEIESWSDLPLLFDRVPVAPELGQPEIATYRPVTALSFAIDARLWGNDPFGFHLLNALWHALVVVLLGLFLGRFLSPAASFLGAALFALHPVHVEAVASLAGRAELLAGAAYVGALLLYVSRSRPFARDGPSVGSAVTLGLLYLAAILAKETAFTLPAVLFVVDAARGDIDFRRIGEYFRRRALVYAALLAGAVGGLALRYAALGGGLFGETTAVFGADGDVRTRLFTMLTVWPHYVRLLLAPLDLSPDYSPAVISPQAALTPAAVLGLALVAAIFALAVRAWRRRPWVLAGPFWVAITLFPASNLLYSSGFVLTEPSLFLPSAGVVLSAAALGDAAFRARRAVRALVWTAAVLVIAAFGARTVLQTPVWASSETVIREVLESHPESYRAHWLQGRELAGADRRPEALAAYARALELWPHDERVWIDLTRLNERWGRRAEAAEAARQAVEAAPRSGAARRVLASALLAAGRYPEAREEAWYGMAAVGGDPILFEIVAGGYRREGQFAAAARARRASLNPGRWSGWIDLAQLHHAAGDEQAAFAALDTAGLRAGRLPEAHDSIESVRLRWIRAR